MLKNVLAVSLCLGGLSTFAAEMPEIPPGYKIIDGDEIVPLGFLDPVENIAYDTDFWTGGVVPYQFDANVSTLNRNRTLDAMAEWTAVANVYFVERTDHANYVHIQSRNSNSSQVGMVGGGQVLNMVSWSWKFIIAHELGHALGLWHEHQRPDRGQYIEVHPENMQPGTSFSVAIVSEAEIFGPYDFDSVMHYGQCAFSDCFCPSSCTTITVLPPNQSWQNGIGQRSHLSTGDGDGMAFLYGGPGLQCSSATSCPSLNTGLVAYWPLDEGGREISGSGLPLSFAGGVCLTEDGAVCSAARFGTGGASAALRNQDDPELDFGDGEFTISAWIRFDDLAGNQIIMGKADGPDGWQLSKTSSLLFFNAPPIGVISGLSAPSVDLVAGQWHHVVIRRMGSGDGVHTTMMILDGVPTGIRDRHDPADALIDVAAGLRLGSGAGGDQPFEGDIDDLAIWNRGLSFSEITYLYNDGNARPVPVPGGGPCPNIVEGCVCAEHGNCADGDGDGIRDDGCVWWACDGGACAATDIPFADMGGQFGACQPDGTADGNDRFHALNCFANVDADQSGAYPCETAPPAATNVDAGGPFGACQPDGVCDGNDAFHALNAFENASTCSCPLDGGPQPGRGSSRRR